MWRDIGEYNRIRANDRSGSNRNAGADHDILAEPNAITDIHRCDLRNALIEDGEPTVVECMSMVGDVDIPGE
jgi:hypothetical protein